MLQKHKHKREQPVLKDRNRICVVCKEAYLATSWLQKTCSSECRKIHYAENGQRFRDANPKAMTNYNANRLKKNPKAWREKWDRGRAEIIKLLGGRCCVPKCPTKNPLHFHIDYIPTMIGTGYRHPRHKKWVIEHIKEFRLICANHHYELTITGKIEGTNITQRKR